MNTNNIVTIELDLPPIQQHVVNYNLILLENSKVSTKQLIELFETFNNQNPKSFTYIFDFSKDVENLIDFAPVIEYIDAYENQCGFVPQWSMCTVNPWWLGNCNLPSQMQNRLEICKNIVIQCLNGYALKLQNIWTDMNGE